MIIFPFNGRSVKTYIYLSFFFHLVASPLFIQVQSVISNSGEIALCSDFTLLYFVPTHRHSSKIELVVFPSAKKWREHRMCFGLCCDGDRKYLDKPVSTLAFPLNSHSSKCKTLLEEIAATLWCHTGLIPQPLSPPCSSLVHQRLKACS